ncbi:hypothetical protein DENIS_1724 [Desulfonema ishimotonii]|uniref:Transmembrane protein n=1 Tax=Desulfonema ishimotonii TaxID=45657 RepID=A0A401FUY5_9BACT|nr:hypothetical protein [Desulfonema ishimotonii]GBC60765.1 hypothetical protein DENIS_1724 [Desulfonema ishimotonii]
MKNSIRAIGPGLFLLAAAPALATQGHGDPEGLYVHQMSHIFFVFSMGILIYWLRARKLVRESGWRYIQYAGFFFILWTLDAFVAHLLDEQLRLVQVTRIDRWHIRLDAHSEWLELVYYIVKLDHLLCVPAMIFFYMGVRRLLMTVRHDGSVPGISEAQ